MPDANDILQIYLGTDEGGGYQPVGNGEDRLAEAFPDEEVSLMMDGICRYLDFWIEELLSDDLAEAAEHFETKIGSEYPELDEISRRALGSRYAYCLK